MIKYDPLSLTSLKFCKSGLPPLFFIACCATLMALSAVTSSALASLTKDAENKTVLAKTVVAIIERFFTMKTPFPIRE